MKNRELKLRYDSVYQKGSSKFYSFSSYPESQTILTMLPSWSGLDVMEIGCGEGRLAAMVSFAGARRVTALDYSAEAIKIAEKSFEMDNVEYLLADYHEHKGKYDVVIMQGVLEHLDKPFEELAAIMRQFLVPGGVLITSSPSFINPRGYVWMTLALLSNVPMSLSDLHFLSPPEFIEFGKKNKCTVEMRSCDHDWGGGDRLLVDFRKRLPNALRDAGMRTDGIPGFMEWLQSVLPYQAPHELGGANIVYKIVKKRGHARS